MECVFCYCFCGHLFRVLNFGDSAHETHNDGFGRHFLVVIGVQLKGFCVMPAIIVLETLMMTFLVVSSALFLKILPDCCRPNTFNIISACFALLTISPMRVKKFLHVPFVRTPRIVPFFWCCLLCKSFKHWDAKRRI